MSYRIAVASSDGEQIDLHFGGASFFYIYEVDDGGNYSLLERRLVPQVEGAGGAPASCAPASCAQGGDGCAPSGAGCSGLGGGGCGAAGPSARVELLADVRAVIAAKIGFNATKQLEKRAISSFDVDCSVEEALEKITKYFYSVDNHVSLARR